MNIMLSRAAPHYQALLLAPLALSLTFGLPGTATAESGKQFPSKPIRIITPFPAGGSTDNFLRPIALRIAKTLGQPVVIEPRPGGNTIIASSAVAKSAPDGYTLLIAVNTLLTNAALYHKLSYNTGTDLVPVTYLGEDGFAIAVSGSLPVTNLAGLISLAKSRPGGLTYGTSTTGGTTHLGPVMLEQMAGIKLTQVPYKGGPTLLSDLGSGIIDLAFDGYSGLAPMVPAGRIRVIAQSGNKRSPSMPDIPLASETPGLEKYSLKFHVGVYAPAGTPKPVLTRLNLAFRQAVAEESKSNSTAFNLDPLNLDVDESAHYFQKELAFWTDAVRRSGVTIQE
ncbi:tripartite tricarboxylate transporter substrate binding protein [Cupriavidus necator]|uniref:Tripartite tricarboxylate transporter substrate binding protein n=1 Tax=Cupriavidus necator TaxID=106590 RepID=A0A1U9V2U1_CUPNE|nr:tripartite tricarboxylate transporter substrate binding protein [Cupriavidus necator]AQV98705.1 tripartite tricarboxylate transporter substrate binding protein [Cupriavidus necator]